MVYTEAEPQRNAVKSGGVNLQENIYMKSYVVLLKLGGAALPLVHGYTCHWYEIHTHTVGIKKGT